MAHMQLAYSHLTEHLARTLEPIYFVHGAELLLVQEAADAIRTKARSCGYSERQSFSVIQTKFDWNEVLQSANSLSLFSDQQIIEVHIPTGKPGREGGAAIERLVADLLNSQNTLLIVVVPIECDRSTKNTAWFKALSEHAVVVAAPPLTRAQLGPWIKQRLTQARPQALRLPADAEGAQIVHFLVEQLEGNVLAAHQEIEKLALSYPGATLDLPMVERSVLNVARYDPQQLTEAMLLGKATRAQTILHGLRAEGAEIVMLAWGIGEALRNVRALWGALQQGQSIALALREQRIWGPREKWLAFAVPKLHAGLVMRSLHGAWIVDGISKGIPHPEWPRDPWVALEQLIQQFIAGLRRARTGPQQA